MLGLGKQGKAGHVGLTSAEQGAESIHQPLLTNLGPDGQLEVHSQEDGMNVRNPNKAQTAATRSEKLDPPRRAPSNTDPAPSEGILQEPIGPPNPSADNVLVRFWKAVSQKLSDAVARLKEFLRRPRSKKPIYSENYRPSDITGSGPFDIPIKQETNPLHPLVETGNRDQFFKEFKRRSNRFQRMETPGIIQRFLRKTPPKQSADIIFKNHQSVEKELRSQLQQLDALLKEESRLEESIAKGVKFLTSEIRDMLPKSTRMGASAIPNLVEKISDYKSTVLLNDQTRIKLYLPEDQEYLVRLIGFLGPKNVLAPMVHDAIQRSHLMGEAKWLSENPKDFIPKLEGIQKELGKLIAFNQEIELKAAKGTPMSLKDEPDPKIMATIKKIENQLIEDLGGREKLKIALDDIESWDIHKGLMKKMKDKSSVHGLLLQLIEPWGYMRRYEKIPENKLPYNEWGVEVKNLQLLDARAKHYALEVIQEQLKTAAGLRRVERNIHDILIPRNWFKDFPHSSNKQ